MNVNIKEIFYIDKNGHKNTSQVVVSDTLSELLKSRVAFISKVKEDSESTTIEKKAALKFPKMVSSIDYVFDGESEIGVDSFSEEYDFLEFEFCPFSGEKINYTIIDKVDVSEEANSILTALEELTHEEKFFDSKNATKLETETNCITEKFKLTRRFYNLLGLNPSDFSCSLLPF